MTTKPWYINNSDHPKQEPVPAWSKKVAAVIALLLVITAAYCVSSCADMEMPYGLGQVKQVNKPHQSVHVESAEDGP